MFEKYYDMVHEGATLYRIYLSLNLKLFIHNILYPRPEPNTLR
jgi:hypothetical protein